MNTPTQTPAVATHTPTITASIGSTGASFHYNNVASHPLSFRIEYRPPELSEEGQQLATFIVRCCNSHAQLVAALEDLLRNATDKERYISILEGTDVETSEQADELLDSPEMKRARAVLQAAKE